MSNRARERGDASELIGHVTCLDSDGDPIPFLDDDGREILGIATGELHDQAMASGGVIANSSDQLRDDLGRWAAAGTALGERIGRGESSHQEIAQYVADGERLGVPQAELSKLHGQLSRRQGYVERGEEIAKLAREAAHIPVSTSAGDYSPKASVSKPRRESIASSLPQGEHADVLRELHERAGRGETTHEQIEEHVASLRALPAEKVYELYNGMGFHQAPKNKQWALNRITKRIGDRLGHAERGREISDL